MLHLDRLFNAIHRLCEPAEFTSVSLHNTIDCNGGAKFFTVRISDSQLQDIGIYSRLETTNTTPRRIVQYIRIQWRPILDRLRRVKCGQKS